MNHSDINRKDNETIENYLLRLGDNRDIWDLSWIQIRDLMNEAAIENFGESKWRKEYHLLKKGYELALKEKCENGYLQEIEEKTIEYQKERFKYQDQKREYTNLIRQQARFEHLKDEIDKSIKEVAKHKPLKFNPPLLYRTNKKRAIVLWSDWHTG